MFFWAYINIGISHRARGPTLGPGGHTSNCLSPDSQAILASLTLMRFSDKSNRGSQPRRFSQLAAGQSHKIHRFFFAGLETLNRKNRITYRGPEILCIETVPETINMISRKKVYGNTFSSWGLRLAATQVSSLKLTASLPHKIGFSKNKGFIFQSHQFSAANSPHWFQGKPKLHLAGWWFFSTHLKNMQPSKWVHLPQFSG